MSILYVVDSVLITFDWEQHLLVETVPRCFSCPWRRCHSTYSFHNYKDIRGWLRRSSQANTILPWLSQVPQFPILHVTGSKWFKRLDWPLSHVKSYIWLCKCKSIIRLKTAVLMYLNQSRSLEIVRSLLWKKPTGVILITNKWQVHKHEQ